MKDAKNHLKYIQKKVLKSAKNSESPPNITFDETSNQEIKRKTSRHKQIKSIGQF